MDLLSLVDWTQVPLVVTVAAILLARAWQSRELQALRARVEELDEEVFEGTRRLNAAKRANQMLRDELGELRGTVENGSEEDEEGAAEEGAAEAPIDGED